MSIYKKLLTSVANQFPTFGRLKKNEDGIAAIEFAFIAPIMIGLYFGMTEIAMGIMTDRNVSHATAVSADLATQLPFLNSVELSDVMTATVAVMNVPVSRLDQISIELNSYQMQNDGTIDEVGYARLGAQISTGGPTTYDPSGLSAQLFNAQSGVVVARINYNYEPQTFKFVSAFTMAETLVMKPRKSISVPFDEGGANTFTCSMDTDRLVSCNPSG